jgi:hypothetical protein
VHVHHHLSSAPVPFVETENGANRVLHTAIRIDRETGVLRPNVTDWHRQPELAATRFRARSLKQTPP